MIDNPVQNTETHAEREGVLVRTAYRSFARETEVRAKINKFVPLNIKSDVVVADLNADVDWLEASSATSGRTPFLIEDIAGATARHSYEWGQGS